MRPQRPQQLLRWAAGVLLDDACAVFGAPVAKANECILAGFGGELIDHLCQRFLLACVPLEGEVSSSPRMPREEVDDAAARCAFMGASHV